jgi:geranylgeranyl diphosphate synthase type II
MLTAQAMGVEETKILSTAAAMQLSEEWILVHEDIEDNSEERRGQPALHRLYGPELALNAGDSLHVLMWKVIFDALSQNPAHSARLCEEFYQLLNRTTLGQTLDIKWTKDNILDLSEDDIFLIMESKTCYYTISGPMRLGAILAGAGEKELNHLYQFGIYLGRAFQIIDDLLDLTSDFSGLKKQQYNDLYEGKRTVLLSHLWRCATEVEKKTIFAIMSKPRSQKSATDIGLLVDLMTKYKTFDYTRALAHSLGAQAQDYFDRHLEFLLLEPFRSQIKQGINFIVTRDH